MSDWRTASHKRSLASYGSTLVEKNVLLTFTITDPHRGNHPVAFKVIFYPTTTRLTTIIEFEFNQFAD